MILILLLLAAALLLIPCLTDRRGMLRAVLVTECVLCVLGVLCVILSAVSAREVLADPALTDDTRAWAGDMYFLWLRMSGIFAAAVGGCVLLAALIRHPMRRVRAGVIAAVFAVLLILGQTYRTVAANDAADLTLPLSLWTVGCACLSRLGAVVDAVCLQKTPGAVKNIPQKKKRP